MDSPRDLEERFHWMHLSQWGISICQLDGCDAERPHITAGVVRVVVLLFTGYDLAMKHSADHQGSLFKPFPKYFSFQYVRRKEDLLVTENFINFMNHLIGTAR